MKNRLYSSPMSSISITAAYAFFPLEEAQIVQLQEELRLFGMQREMRGLVLIAPEGINSTVCGTQAAIDDWKARLRKLKDDIIFKDSFADRLVFKRWSVKIKKEIVTIKQPQIQPKGKHRHISPQQWNDMLKQEDVMVIDTRNAYEVALGKFKNAIDPGTRHFQEFPDFVKQANIPKEKKVMLYCTGGIRCEKAIHAMEEQGYQNVFQLDGGILAYLEQFPHQQFEGECFVFDRRVAVDQELAPSKIYKLCRGCGDPSDQGEKCKRCMQLVKAGSSK